MDYFFSWDVDWWWLRATPFIYWDEISLHILTAARHYFYCIVRFINCASPWAAMLRISLTAGKRSSYMLLAHYAPLPRRALAFTKFLSSFTWEFHRRAIFERHWYAHARHDFMHCLRLWRDLFTGSRCYRRASPFRLACIWVRAPMIMRSSASPALPEFHRTRKVLKAL